MNKKIFSIMLIFIALVSMTFVSASENDTALSLSDGDDVGISDDNISLQSNGIIGNSIESEDILSEDLIPTKISVVTSADGIIESDKVTITVTLTDENDNPLNNFRIHQYENNKYKNGLDTNSDGQVFVTMTKSSGFYYEYFEFRGDDTPYAPSSSQMIELVFANDNTLTDFAVRMIMSDGVMNLTKDYKGYGSNKVERHNVSNYTQKLNDYKELNKGIPIDKNLVINGNGHTIDVSGDSYLVKAFYDVNNHILTLNNMTFVNGYSLDNSATLFGGRYAVTYNLNNVLIANCTSVNSIFGQSVTWTNVQLSVNARNSSFINNIFTYYNSNNPASLFYGILMNSTFEQCLFINNTRIFIVTQIYNLNVRNSIFLDNSQIFWYDGSSVWEYGYVTGNYWGTNDSSVINSILPKGDDVNYNFGFHSYLTISGDSTFCEDDVQDYEIYFSGSNANQLPVYETSLSYTSAYSTINATDIKISSNPTTVRVTPKTYGVETLVVDPDLYELNINITKSTKINYKVTVDAPQSEYLTPLVITVNVKDDDDNPVTTKANITVDATTHTINITDGVGKLEVNNLAIGRYDVTTKIISNMANYRNTTVYSTATVNKIRPTITLSCSNQTSIARENITFNVNVKNRYNTTVPNINVSLIEDDVVVAESTTDAEGNIIFIYAPEAGEHTYYACIRSSDYSFGNMSDPVEVNVISKIPTKLTISSDTEMITEPGQKATFNVKLVDVNNTPIIGAEINLVANDVVVDTANTNSSGECVFEFADTSNLYEIKAVYDGNLIYYDNSSEIIELIIATSGNFFDLSVLINATKEDGVLTLGRDFIFNETLDQDFVNGIPINKNIIINGGNYTINALNKAKMFNIDAETVEINDLNVVNANSVSNGGAIYFDGNTLTVSNTRFENNTATLSGYPIRIYYLGGGAIYSNGALNVINSTFNNNKIFVHNDADVWDSGGGAIFVNGDLNIYNSVFDYNIAKKVKIVEEDVASSVHASSVYANGGLTSIYNSTFKNGLADTAALYYYNIVNGNFSVYDSVFLNNTASYDGAMTINSVNGRIINTTFENNSAKNREGGINVQSTDSLLISESKFINNSANNYSSAIYVFPGNNLVIEKSYFINNHAVNGGTISYADNTFLDLRYNIFVNNTGNASGVYYEVYEEVIDDGNLNYDYWGNNTPYDANVFNEYIRQGYEYITLEIVGENVTYTTIPTNYIIKFNGTNADKLPNFETLIEALADAGVSLDKTSIVINGSGANVVLTSDVVQNITLVVGPEYNVLATFNIVVEQLIKKNYTSNITVNPTVYGSTVVATIEILDEDGKGANGSLAYTFNGRTQNATIENGEALIPLSRLDAGEYDISFVFNTTDLFYNDISGNKTFTISKANTTFTLDVTNITYGEDEVIIATPQRGVDGNFTFYIKDILNQTVEIEMGQASWTLVDFPAGNYTVTVTYNGNENYNPVSQSKNFTISKAESKIEISIDDVNYGDEIIAVVTGVNVTGNVTVTVNNKDYPVEVVNNRGNVTIDKLDVGKYNATVTFDGNTNITGLNNRTEFEVFKASADMTVDVGESISGQNTTVTVKFRDDVEGTVTITVDNKPTDVPIKNGVAALNLTGLAEGKHTVNVTYPGNSNFNSSAFNTTFSTKSVASKINVTASDIVYGNILTVKATVTSDATGDVEFTIGNITKTGTIKGGAASATFEGLNAGNHNITARYLGDSTYISSTNTTTATVSKANSTVLIDVGEIVEGQNVVITFTASANATGNITVEIPGLYSPRNRTLENGVNKWTITPVYGNHTVKVTYNGDNNYLASSNSTSIVAKYNPTIKIDVSDAFIGDDYTIDVILNANATGSVLITVDGVGYNRTLKDAKASVTLKNLTAGNHTVEVIYSGDDSFYNATESISFEPKSVISGINVTAKNIVYGNDLVVKATVTSGATGNVEFTVNGVTKSAAIKNSAAEASFSNLNAGDYEITAKYLGDRTHTSATNKTAATVSKATSSVLINVSEIKYGENVVITFTLPSKATGNVTVEIPGLYSPRNRTITNGAASWTISPLKSGTYALNVVYNGDNNYLASSNSTTLISKYNPDIFIEVPEVLVSHDATVNVALPSNATGSVLITVDGMKYNKTLSKGKASVVISNITKGTHNVNVTYSGDENYYQAENSTSFEPKQSSSSINVIASDIDFGEDLIVRAVVNEGATGTVTFTVNGVDKAVQIHQGFASATFADVNAGTYDVKAVYSGNEVYSSSSNSTKTTVSKVNSTLIINVGEIKEGENVVIKFIVPSKATGVVTVEIPGLYSSRNKTITNGAASWTISPLSAGLYEIIASYAGDNNYYGSSNSTSIDYNRVKTTLDVFTVSNKDNIRLVANLTAEDGQLLTAWVNVTVNGSNYRIPVINGIGSLSLGSLPGGDYQYFALYPGTRTIVNSTAEGNFTVVPVVPILTIPDVVKYYKGSERLVVYLMDNYGDKIFNKTVVISINGNEYQRTTNVDGTASIALNLNSGKYIATASASEYSLESSGNVTIMPTVNGTDLVKVYKNATQYYATFRDSEGNYLADGSVVRFNINGVMYERKVSGGKGLAKLNINLAQGEYIITATNPITGENAANNITVISKLVENKDVTKYYRNATQYTVKVLGDDGKAVGAGVEVTFNINGVFYTRTTNASGIAKLTINLAPGEYIITAEYGGCRVSNSIKVLPVLSAHDLSMKYRDGSKFVATLVDGQGKPYAGQTIQFNINGVFYNRVTDNYGQAKLNINLQADRYIITSSYNGANIANKVTIVP